MIPHRPHEAPEGPRAKPTERAPDQHGPMPHKLQAGTASVDRADGGNHNDQRERGSEYQQSAELPIAIRLALPDSIHFTTVSLAGGILASDR